MISRSLLLFALSVLAGCKIVYGPVIRNHTATPAEFWAEYASGERSYVRLEPGTSLWQGKRGVVPDQIIVLQSGTRLEFDRSYIQGVLARVTKLDEAMILFDGVKLEALSIRDAKKISRKP